MENEKEKLNETMNAQDILLKNGELNIDVIPETMNPEQFIDLLKRSLYPLCKDYQEKPTTAFQKIGLKHLSD